MTYKIGNICVEMTPHFPRLTRQAAPFAAKGQADFSIGYTKEMWKIEREKYPYLSEEELEYILLGLQFYEKAIAQGSYVLHASAVVYQGKAYAFSASSGVGKSTHTQHWLQMFPGSYLLNDDKPLLTPTAQGCMIHGTPFTGKSTEVRTESITLGGICFLERGMRNSIRRAQPVDVVYHLLNQTLRPNNPELYKLLLQYIQMTFSQVPIYQMNCTADKAAARLSWQTMTAQRRENDSLIFPKEGEIQQIANGMLHLNATGMELWNALREGWEESQLVTYLIAKYEVEEVQAQRDVATFLTQLRIAGVIT